MTRRTSKRVSRTQRRKAAATNAPRKAVRAASLASTKVRHAGYAVSGDTTAAPVVAEYSKSLFGDVLEGVVGHLEDRVAAAHRGDLRDADALLIAQAVGLNFDVHRTERDRPNESLDVPKRNSTSPRIVREKRVHGFCVY